MHIVQIALPVPIDRLFDYLPPNNTPQPVIGARARVLFGNRKMIGIAVNISKTTNLPLDRLKKIDCMIDTQSLFSPVLWKVLQWASYYYHFPIGMVLNHALPVLLRKGNSIQEASLKQWSINNAGRKINIESLQHAPKQQQVLTFLRLQSLFYHQLSKKGFTKVVLNTLCKKGLCQLHNYVRQKHDWRTTFRLKSKQLKLNDAQKLAIQSICNENSHYTAWLLVGTFESEKTEVFLRILEDVLARGKQALVLVPEISLTPQTVAYFHERFNAPIDVLHSTLNNNKRYITWQRARNGESAIVIGTRSALFTPFLNLGIIIVDEEHDKSYKQREGWCYQARDLAVLRAHEENIPIIMGSATPSLETLHNVNKGKYRQLDITKYTKSISMVRQQLIDLKGQPLKSGLASVLLYKIKQHLDSNNQVLLILNRRGFSPIFLCHNCGWLAKCHQCESYYTLHQLHNQLRCHHCNSQFPLPDKCMSCNSIQLMSIGVGTEQLEQQLRIIFPRVPISRIDSDTIDNKDTLQQYLFNIKLGGAHILIGTQMLAKGNHFPDVTLVSILNVDNVLFSTDFRATERFAQLYIKVANLSGIINKQGEVLLQTYYPEHPLLQTLISNGYFIFAERMLLERKTVQLPPWTNHVLFRAKDIDNDKIATFLTELRRLLENNQFQDKSMWLMGPVPAPAQKRNGYWRWQLLLQHPSRKKLHQLLNNSLPLIFILNTIYKVKWTLDIDPVEN